MFNRIKRYINHIRHKKNSKEIAHSNKFNKAKGAAETILTPSDEVKLYKDYLGGLKLSIIERKYHIGSNHCKRVIKAFHPDLASESTLIAPSQYLVRINNFLSKLKSNSIPRSEAYLCPYIMTSLERIIGIPNNVDPLALSVYTFIGTHSSTSIVDVQKRFHINSSRTMDIIRYLVNHHFVYKNVDHKSKPQKPHTASHPKRSRKKSHKKSHKQSANPVRPPLFHPIEFGLMKYSIKPISYILVKYNNNQPIPSSYLANYSLLRKSGAHFLCNMARILQAFTSRKHICSTDSWKRLTTFDIQHIIVQYRKSVYRAIFDHEYLHVPVTRASKLNYLTPDSVYHYLHMPYVMAQYKSKQHALRKENVRSVQLKFKNL